MRAAGFLARRMVVASGRRTMASSHGHHGHDYPHGMHFHGLKHPWDHGDHDEAHSEAAHSGKYLLVDGKIQYKRSEIGAMPMPIEIDDDEESDDSLDDDVLDDLHDEEED